MSTIDRDTTQRLAHDAHEMCREAIDAGLVIQRVDPLNAESRLTAVGDGAASENARFFIRNHAPIPRLDPATFRLAVSGLVDRPIACSLDDLRRMRVETTAVTLECAGNGRTMFDRPSKGQAWGLGAVGTASWTGVPLADVLDRAGVRASASHVMFRGADVGPLDTGEDPTPLAYERSLSIDDARGEHLLLAYAMNGEPLPPSRGYPLRLVVPGWYGMASVKWLTEIELTDRPSSGPYQVVKYWYEWERDGGIVREPVTLMQVRAVIAEPTRDATMTRGEIVVRGVAWSGAAPIARVDVSVGPAGAADAASAWQPARLTECLGPYACQHWECVARVDQPGPCVVRARATDRAGRTQPEFAEYNRIGYGNNSIHQVTVQVA
jgi:DMSO/TMAO reductase YedYZ molybdopterin-dependent catalytic subunit